MPLLNLFSARDLAASRLLRQDLRFLRGSCDAIVLYVLVVSLYLSTGPFGTGPLDTYSPSRLILPPPSNPPGIFNPYRGCSSKR